MRLTILIGLAGSGCTGTTPTDGVRTDQGDAFVIEYDDDSGVACVSGTEGSAVRVLVDFGDCFECSTNDMWCEAALEGDATLVVHGGGSVLVERDCDGGGTCDNTAVHCDGPLIESGSYTLSYGGVEVPFTFPTGTLTCTGPSGLQ